MKIDVCIKLLFQDKQEKKNGTKISLSAFDNDNNEVNDKKQSTLMVTNYSNVVFAEKGENQKDGVFL